MKILGRQWPRLAVMKILGRQWLRLAVLSKDSVRYPVYVTKYLITLSNGQP
jgi:hypothetical protein